MQQSKLIIVLLALGAAAVSARPQRDLKQVTFFYNTPQAAGSTSVDVNGNVGLRPDGTVQAAAGGALTSSNAVSNPLLNVLTGGAYQNRPQADSIAYTQIPLVLGSTAFPTLSYGATESNGDLVSSSTGAWGNAEFGYNPISNNLGASASAGTAGSTHLGGSDAAAAGPGAGASGIEFAGWVNDLTTLADARTNQQAQAKASPFNPLSPLNTLTCTQALLYAATFTNYDLGAPVNSLPREGGVSNIPFCLSLFNFATLDDFSSFVNNETDANTVGQAENPTTANVNAQTGNDGPVTVNGTPPPVVLRPLPGPEEEGDDSEGRSAAAAASTRAPQVPTFSSLVSEAIQGAPQQIRQIAGTPLFAALLERATSGPFATAFDGLNQLGAKQLGRVAQTMGSGPVADMRQAASNITRAVVSGVGNTAMKGAVAGIEAAEPVLAAGTAVARAVAPAAKASRAAAEKLSAQAEKRLAESVKGLPAEARKEVTQALDSRKPAQPAAKPAAAAKAAPAKPAASKKPAAKAADAKKPAAKAAAPKKPAADKPAAAGRRMAL